MSADNYHMWTTSGDGTVSVWYVFASDFDWDDPVRHAHFCQTMMETPIATFPTLDEALEWMAEEWAEYGDFEVDLNGREVA